MHVKLVVSWPSAHRHLRHGDGTDLTGEPGRGVRLVKELAMWQIGSIIVEERFPEDASLCAASPKAVEQLPATAQQLPAFGSLRSGLPRISAVLQPGLPAAFQPDRRARSRAQASV